MSEALKPCPFCGKDESKRLNGLIVDAAYMLAATRNMLGPKGLEVVAGWDARKVNRVHYSWGDDAHLLTGEERAAFILAWEVAPRREIAPGELDRDSPTEASRSELLKEAGGTPETPANLKPIQIKALRRI